jgi:DNA-binding response OmpR family regulator
MIRARVLLVEDEPGLVLRLAVQGYSVEAVRDGLAALERARREPFDLIVLDVMLPKLSGFEVCRRLREEDNLTPVLMLTARDQLADKIHGLQIGADDYLTKPFEVLELLARIEALLRRAQAPPPAAAPSTIRAGSIVIDYRKMEVTVNGEPVSLTAREFQLLRYLADRAGETISREELLEKVWGLRHIPNTRTVDVHMTWLRQKLELNPRYPRHLLTVRGFGYKFEA